MTQLFSKIEIKTFVKFKAVAAQTQTNPAQAAFGGAQLRYVVTNVTTITSAQDVIIDKKSPSESSVDQSDS